MDTLFANRYGTRHLSVAFPDLLTLLCQFAVMAPLIWHRYPVLSLSKCAAFPVELATPFTEHFNILLPFALSVITA